MKLILDKFKYRLAGSYITSTISLTLVLLIVGTLFLTIFNAKDLSRKTKESISLTVIIKESATEVEVNEMLNILQIADFTKDVEYVSKEIAAKSLQDELGEDFESILEYNPLPNTFELKLLAEYTNLDSISIIEQKIKQNTLIEDVFYHKALVNTVDSKMKALVYILSFLGFIVFFIAAFLINNTIRLTIYSKRFSIKTMQLVGATNNFIMKPFLINSLVQGAISSFISILILIISILFLQKSIVEVFIISFIGIVFFITFIFGLIITTISTYFSLNRYLNSGIDNLYY
jgi:cell division transport system permease protein